MDHVITSDGRLRVWETFRQTSPQDLFSFWTEPAKLCAWWPSQAELEAVPSGRYRYHFASINHTLTGTFSEVEPGRRLAFSWQWQHEPDAPERQVVVDFERRDSDTLLTLTHGPYVGDENERQSHLEGWEYFLGRLKKVVKQG